MFSLLLILFIFKKPFGRSASLPTLFFCVLPLRPIQTQRILVVVIRPERSGTVRLLHRERCENKETKQIESENKVKGGKRKMKDDDGKQRTKTIETQAIAQRKRCGRGPKNGGGGRDKTKKIINTRVRERRIKTIFKTTFIHVLIYSLLSLTIFSLRLSLFSFFFTHLSFLLLNFSSLLILLTTARVSSLFLNFLN